MAVNSVKIFDDTVLKLSVNQGLEDQRATETLGSFTMGELAFTRDTGRLFVGDNSDENHFGLQETVGGILTGNKYLGLIDSKPLVTFTDTGKPLSYETPTSKVDEASKTENALLLKDSKFRLKSPEGADEEWERWDRTATYNAKYNAYNGDYMFDIYNNALILFDNRITTDPDSEFQPKIKMVDADAGVDEDGNENPSSDNFQVRAEPETFIIDGEEISSYDDRAIDIKRRTVIQNYNKDNEDYTNIHPVYGDGYVVMRIVEPDNETIRFRPRSFDTAGNPLTDDDNFSHNLLEILNVSAKHLTGAMSNDFVVADLVYLNKEIADVKSITGNNGVLKIPMNLVLSNATGGEDRGAVGAIRIDFQPLGDIPADTTEDYKIVLSPAETIVDDKNNDISYRKFRANIVQDIPHVPTYRIKLAGGLASSQFDSETLQLDITATDDNDDNLPILGVDPALETRMYRGEDRIPYTDIPGLSDYLYINNLVVSESGRVVNSDVYADSYYELAKDRIDQFEEQNTSINYLKNPVTIISTSVDDLGLNLTEDNVSVNARLDFLASPYLYCRYKTVTSPNTTMLPAGNPDTYNVTFTNTNTKVWNESIAVMGRNNYSDFSKKESEIPVIKDGFTSSIKKSVFKILSQYTTDKNGNFKTYDDTKDEDKSEFFDNLVNAVFYWYKEEFKDDEGNDQVVYYAHEDFDSRSAMEQDQQGKHLEFVYVEGTNTNLIDGGNGVFVRVEDTGDIKTTHYAIFPDSPLLNRFQSYITYGSNGGYEDNPVAWSTKYDLKIMAGLTFGYNILIDNAYLGNIESITFKRGTADTTISKGQALSWLQSNNNRLTIDTLLPNSSVTVNNFDIAIFQYTPNFEELSPEEEALLTEAQKKQREEERIQAEIDARVVYKILPDVYYLEGATPPSGIDTTDRVYIPNQARNVILEVTHITDTNNRIGIFYANEVDELKALNSGVDTITSFVPPFSAISYDSSGKLTPSTPRFTEAERVLAPNNKEKMLCVTSATETRIIEVPLQKSRNYDQRHFSLRLANIVPMTSTETNYLAIRVLGYRV